jgi:hypothetical protein
MLRWMWKAAAVAAGTAVVLAFASWAQEDEPLSCVDACYEAEERCSETCYDADDPAACEDRCLEQSKSCLEKCE